MLFSCTKNAYKHVSLGSENQTYPLVHTVYFTLEPANSAQLIKTLESVKNIEEVHHLKIGAFTDLGDKRALKDYNVVMQMQFENIQAYEAYQSHPIHMQLKKDVKPLLKAPPATHDFMIE